MIEPLQIGLRCQHTGRLDQIEIEITGRARQGFVPPAEDKARYSEPLDQMLALKPRFEFRLSSGKAIVEDGEYTGLCRHFAATTMISTL